MKFVLLAMLAFASKNENDFESAAANLGEKIVENAEKSSIVKIEEDEYVKKTRDCKFIGVFFHQKLKLWFAERWSKTEKKAFRNGSYKDEETAAHASDTLARRLIANGEQHQILNFAADTSVVNPKERIATSKYIGVTYHEKMKRWVAQRWGKADKKIFNNGSYRDEKTAAIASDVLARNLMVNGEHHKLNFPDESNEHPQQQSNKRKRSFGYFQTNIEK